MNIIETELKEVEWKEGYLYQVFDGTWFATKYAIENDWKDKKIVLLFPKNTYPHSEAEQLKFPLLDMLMANMEYKEDDYASFMQQNGLPSKFNSFVQRNVTELMSSKINTILSGQFSTDTFTEDLACRAFISSYLGEKKLLEWDTIIVRMIISGANSEEKKHNDLFRRIEKNLDAKKAIDNKLNSLFGFSYDRNSETKMKEVAESLKYNSMTQLLDSSSADNYKQYKVTNSGKLIQLNKIYEKGTQDRLLSDRFNQAMITLAAGIKEEEIIKVYGIDAPYFYMTETLCWPIIEGMIKAELIAEPMKVNEHIRELSLKLPEQSVIQIVFRFVEQMALYYEKARIIGTLKLNTPEAYIQKYLNEFYSIDMCYRRALEAYHELITKDIPIDQPLYKAKQQLDQEYARIVNVFNLEWIGSVTEQADGFNGLSLKRQEDFYANEYDVSYKQVVIVSDALRYEVAAELMEELAKEKHVATLSAYRAMLPTETKYCKPALLPHRTLQWQGNDLLVDGKLLPGISERTAHLANYKEHAVCVNYEDVMNGDQASNRALFKRPLVYIFHNTIDEASHSQSPFEVIAACRKAIQQLAVLINRLHASWNVNYVMLTADHGFIYNDIRFEEKDKHSIKDDCIEKKTRYYLTNSQQAIDGIAKFPLQSASGMSSKEAVQIAVPLGTNRLAAPGGYNFAHGGATLQEMIIPVIHSKLRKVEKTEKVNVALVNPNLSMVSSRLKFQLIQSEAVSMNVKERTIICGVYNGDDLVTESKRVTLNSTDSINLNNRVYDITLILNKSTTSTMLQLRIYDEEDMLNPIIRETVKNNTMIEQDF
jgi:uncharacterized protein (TIGR02687 family)